MSALRPIGAFLLCVIVSNAVFLTTFFAPVIVAELSRPGGGWSELVAAAAFISAFSLPIIFMGGLSFGLGGWWLARNLDMSRSIVAMSAIGAVSAIAYAVFVVLLLSGLTGDTWRLIIPAGAAGAASGAIWALLFERHARV